MFTFSAFFLVSGTSVIDFRYFVSASPEGLLCPIERVLASITFHFSTFLISHSRLPRRMIKVSPSFKVSAKFGNAQASHPDNDRDS